MKLRDCREARYYYSGKASDTLRQLGLAGIAVIWIFKTEVNGKPLIPQWLTLAGALLLVGLALDMAQYLVGNRIWEKFNRKKELEGKKEEDEFTAPPDINDPTNFFFWAKAGAMILACTIIAGFLFHRFSMGG